MILTTGRRSHGLEVGDIVESEFETVPHVVTEVENAHQFTLRPMTRWERFWNWFNYGELI